MNRSGQISADLAIAGGGLVGLSLGVALARAGLEVVVMDGEDPARMRSAKFDGRVCSIAYGSKCVLDGIGVWDGMAAEAEPILEIRVSDKDAPLVLHYDHKEVGDHPLGWIVENRVTRVALLDAATTCPTLRHLAPVSVLDFKPTGGRIEASLGDGRRISARLAVGVDGRRSQVRVIVARVCVLPATCDALLPFRSVCGALNGVPFGGCGDLTTYIHTRRLQHPEREQQHEYRAAAGRRGRVPRAQPGRRVRRADSNPRGPQQARRGCWSSPTPPDAPESRKGAAVPDPALPG